MQVSLKQAAGAAIVIILVSFAAGRYTVPTKTTVETKTVTQTKEDKNTQVDTDKDQHVQTIQVQVKKPDGTVVTTTRTERDTDTKQEMKQDDKTDTASTTQTKTETVRLGGNLNVLVTAGVDVTSPTGLVYGLSLSRPILGPILIGAWGMTNKTVGFSLGLQF